MDPETDKPYVNPKLGFEVAREKNAKHLRNRSKSSLKVPRGSIVVPFWDYLIGF